MSEVVSAGFGANVPLEEKLSIPKETLSQILQMVPPENPLYGPLKRLAQELDAVGL